MVGWAMALLAPPPKPALVASLQIARYLEILKNLRYALFVM